MEQQTPRKEPQSSFRGLYKNVKISVQTLDKVIVGGIVLIVVLVLFGIANSGFTVTFDSKGGTDVPAVSDLRYGDLVPEPQPPTREGYVFGGWYSDANCQYPWDFDTMQLPQSMTLYAAWQPAAAP